MQPYDNALKDCKQKINKLERLVASDQSSQRDMLFQSMSPWPWFPMSTLVPNGGHLIIYQAQLA